MNKDANNEVKVKYGNPGVARDMPTDKLFSGQPYQRPVSMRYVDKLVKHWDEKLLTPIVISFRDGNYNVVNGQH